MSPTRALVFLAVLLAGSAHAAPAAEPVDADFVRSHRAADASDLDPVRAAAFKAFTTAPALANQAAHPVARAARTGSIRLLDTPDDPRVAAVHLDHALHGEARLRSAHARAAAEIIDDPKLLDAALGQADASVVAAALAGLHGRPESPWAGVLSAHTRHADPVVRQVAVSVLSRRADAAEHLPALRQATTLPDPQVRVMAVRALGVHGTGAEIPWVEALLEDSNTQVRAVAQLALERLQK